MLPTLEIRPSMRLQMRLAQAAVRREQQARRRLSERDADRALLMALESGLGQPVSLDIRMRVARAARAADCVERARLASRA